MDEAKVTEIDNLFADLRDAKDAGNTAAASLYVAGKDFWRELKRLPTCDYTGDMVCKFSDTLAFAAIAAKQPDPDQ